MSPHQLLATDPETILEAAQKEIKSSNLLQARALLSDALETWPNHLALQYQWGQLLEEIGDIVGAIDAYQNITRKSQEDPYSKSYLNKNAQLYWRQIAEDRLKQLLQKDIALEKLINQFQKDTINIGNQGVKIKKFNSARHAFIEAQKINEQNPQVIEGLYLTKLKIPEAGKNVGELDEIIYEATLQKSRRLIAAKKAQEAIEMMTPYLSSGNPQYFRINYMMAEALRRVGRYEEALQFYDIYLMKTQNNADVHVQKTRQEILEFLPKLTETLKDVYLRRQIFLENLVAYAFSKWKKHPESAQRALKEALKIDPENVKALRLQNRLVQLGALSLFNNNLKKNWTLMKDPPNRIVASYLSQIQYKDQVLTIPKRGRYDQDKTTLIQSPLTFPGYGLLSVDFKVSYDKDELEPAKNFGFGFALKNTLNKDTLLLLLTWEPHTKRIAVRGMELNQKGHFKSVGSLFTKLKTFEEWIKLECLKKGNHYELYINDELSLTLRHDKPGYAGALGLFSAGNTVDVRGYTYTSGILKTNSNNQNEHKLFDRQSLAGWWRFQSSINQAVPLQQNSNIYIHQDQMRLNASPGIPLRIQHEHTSPEDFIWESQFQIQPNSKKSQAEWLFGYDSNEPGGYRVVMEHSDKKILLSLLDDNPVEGAKILDQSQLNLPESFSKQYDLSIAVANNHAVISIANNPLVTAKLSRSSKGSVSLSVKNQIFSLTEMKLKEIKGSP